MKEQKDWNFLDKMVSFVSPTAGARRARARFIQNTIRKYDAAGAGRRNQNWLAPASSSNTENFWALPRLRDRARELSRNDAYATQGIEIIATETVGSGLVPTFYCKKPDKKQKIVALWNAWANTTNCDFEGKKTFYGLQEAVMRCTPESGETLGLRVRIPSKDKLDVPVKIKLLEPDHLDFAKHENFEASLIKGKVRQGIEFDGDGKIIAYWLFKNHPGDAEWNYLPDRIPAENVLHVYREKRIGQIRGITWLHPIMMTLKDLSEYDDAQLMKQKVSACHAGFIHDMEGVSDGLTSDEKDELSDIEPGMMQTLPAGKDITFSNPPSVEGLSEYQKGVLRRVAVGLGVSYEALTNDLSNVNFSSGRMGWIRMRKNITSWRWNMLIPQFCDPSVRWFLDAIELMGLDISDVSWEWTEPRAEMIDPSKELEAQSVAVRNGFKAVSDVIKENGDEPDRVFNQIAQDNLILDQKKIVLDSDPRKMTKAGIAQISGGSSAGQGASPNA